MVHCHVLLHFGISCCHWWSTFVFHLIYSNYSCSKHKSSCCDEVGICNKLQQQIRCRHLAVYSSVYVQSTVLVSWIVSKMLAFVTWTCVVMSHCRSKIIKISFKRKQFFIHLRKEQVSVTVRLNSCKFSETAVVHGWNYCLLTYYTVFSL